MKKRYHVPTITPDDVELSDFEIEDIIEYIREIKPFINPMVYIIMSSDLSIVDEDKINTFSEKFRNIPIADFDNFFNKYK